MKEALLQYNVGFDQRAYQNLKHLQGQISKEEYAQKLFSLNSLSRHNLETAIGERYNVELFQETYQIADGEIYNPSFVEPFIKIVKRGQEFRARNGSCDLRREAAEVEGFIKVQRILARADTPTGQKLIIISPRGNPHSIYQHNFFDVYERRQDNKIRMSRFTCKFSYQEFAHAAAYIDPVNTLPDNPSDFDFLTSPLVTNKTIEEIQAILHPQENTMGKSEYHKLLTACAPLILIYLNDFSQQNYDAILNFADVYLGKYKIHDPNLRLAIIREIETQKNFPAALEILQRIPVRQVKTGCGISGENQTQMSSLELLQRPFSVSEFGLNTCPECSKETKHFHCPGCNGSITQGQGITTCPHCGLTKEQAGSNCA